MATLDYTPIVRERSAHYRLPVALVLAIIQHESQGDPNAQNHGAGDQARGGSYGLMQVSLATASGYDRAVTAQQLMIPAFNIDMGCRYLSDCLNQAIGDVDAAISAYNAGFSRVRPHDGKRVGNTNTDADMRTPFVNQDYVDSVKRWIAKYSVAHAWNGNILLVCTP